ncbi:MAG: 16S rRNA (guanine(966)-N(2))-methyltransferase RsmD [Desulfoprunum sp.]|nr:16S rRNA (guanine(966)-N(2))-methyltransferase RsmD [Desulfoprunum sp.]
MRIISGWARGRKLFSPPANSQAIRPTSDRAREALFNIISGHIEHADVLDLFAGTGALGLEALSRGANTVTFVENSRQALELIKRNLLVCMPGISMSPPDHPPQKPLPHAKKPAIISVIQHDLRKGLPLKTFDKKQLSSFDLVFLDPPYSTGLCQQLLKDWDNHNRLKPDGLLIAEERSSETLVDQFSTLRLVDKRTYGETGFWIYQSTLRNHP